MSVRKSFLAGVAISIGGTAFLSVENKVIGAFLFSLGLLLICVNDYQLFTGKVCYARKPIEFVELLIIWANNITGCMFTSLIILIAKPQLQITAQAVMKNKPQGAVSIILMGIMCNLLIFFAVNGFKTNKYRIGKYIVLILCVMVFILCGFEHCIANTFYMFVSGTVNTKLLLLNTLGNFIGGISIGLVSERLAEEV